jgi:hypothetical protein
MSKMLAFIATIMLALPVTASAYYWPEVTGELPSLEGASSQLYKCTNTTLDPHGFTFTTQPNSFTVTWIMGSNPWPGQSVTDLEEVALIIPESAYSKGRLSEVFIVHVPGKPFTKPSSIQTLKPPRAIAPGKWIVLVTTVYQVVQEVIPGNVAQYCLSHTVGGSVIV